MQIHENKCYMNWDDTFVKWNIVVHYTVTLRVGMKCIVMVNTNKHAVNKKRPSSESIIFMRFLVRYKYSRLQYLSSIIAILVFVDYHDHEFTRYWLESTARIFIQFIVLWDLHQWGEWLYCKKFVLFLTLCFYL